MVLLKSLKNFRKKYKKITPLALGVLLVAIPLLFIAVKNKNKAEAAWWPGQSGGSSWLKRQQLPLINNSGNDLATNITVAVTINTKALVNQGDLQADCDDLRIVYQANTTTFKEVTRYLVYSNNGTCATSEATKVYFPLQATLSNAYQYTYYMYFGNSKADTPTNTDDAFNIGSTQALLVCPFNGTTNCTEGEGNTSSNPGAIRYSGGKTAVEFPGTVFNERIEQEDTTNDIKPNYNQPFTMETWVYVKNQPRDYWASENIMGTNALTNNGGCTTFAGIGVLRYDASNTRLTFSLPHEYTDSCGANTQVISPTSISLNTWHHVAATFDPTSKAMNLYIDGQNAGTATWDAVSWQMNSGEVMFVGDYYFTGLVDESRYSSIVRYAGNFTPTTAPFVRDHYTTFLWHYDENGALPNVGPYTTVADDSGNGHNGTYSANRVFYVDGVVGRENESEKGPTSGNNAFGGHEGVFLERETTNEITNPSFENADFDLNWTASGVTATDNTLYTNKFGSHGAQLTTAGSTGTFTTEVNPGNINTHTLSAYVFRATSAGAGSTANSSIVQLIYNGAAQPTTTYNDAGGGWTRLIFSSTAANALQRFGVSVAANQTLIVDGVQLEEKDYSGEGYATTYTDGGMGSGYQWNGTPNNSTSTRAAADLRYPVTGNLSGTTGTISFWIKNNYFQRFPKDLMGWGNVCSAMNKMRLEAGSPTENYTFSLETDQGATLYVPNLNMGYEKWNHIALTYTPAGRLVYFNGVLAGQDGITTGLGTINSNTPLLIGNGPCSSDISALYGSTLSDLRIFSGSLADTQIADIYQAGLVGYLNTYQVDAFSENKGENPYAIYHFSEGNGTTANDSSANKNHLTISGATWDTTGTKSLVFDGVNDFAYRDPDPDFNPGTGSFTISGLMKYSSTAPAINQTKVLLSRFGTAGYKIYMTGSTGTLCFATNSNTTWNPDDYACSTTNYADSKWHAFSAVKNGTTSIQLYIDGVLVGSDTSISGTGTLNTASKLYVGIDSNGVSYPWHGNIDELYFYPYARTEAQIKNDINDPQVSILLGTNTKDATSNGLMGYWKLDETSGTSAADSSGNGFTGTATDYTPGNGDGNTPPTIVSAKYGYGRNFDGTDDYINLGSNTNLGTALNNQLTLAAWVYPETTNNNEIIRHGDQYFIRCRPSDTGFQSHIDGLGMTGRSSLGAECTPNTWQHFVMTFDGKTRRHYKDGVLIDSWEETGSTNFTDGIETAIGANYNGGAEYFDGSLDEVRVYNRALSPEEVTQLYKWAPGPEGWWKLDDGVQGDNKSIIDVSGHGHTGTTHYGSNSTGMDCTPPGKYGNACKMDGNDHIQVPDSTSLLLDDTNDFSVMLWVYSYDWGASTVGFIGKRGSVYANRDWFLAYNTGGNDIGLWLGDGSGDFFETGEPVSTNAWHHIAFTKQGTTYKIYVDGSPQAEYVSAATWTNSEDLALGNGATTGTWGIKGLMDDIKIYNYARTSSQITEDMNGDHPAPGSPVGSSLVHYKFDEGFGDVVHNTGNGGSALNGSLAGTDAVCPQSGDSACPTWANNGAFGKALSFDTSGTTDDYVQTPYNSSLNITSDLTLSAWVKTSSSATGQYVIQRFGAFPYPGYALTIAPNYGCGTAGQVGFWVGDTTALYSCSSQTINDGTWHHIAGTYTGTTASIYIDGKLVKTDTRTNGLNETSTNLQIGAFTAENLYFDGQIDEVEIYNSALSSDQIKMLYNQKSATSFGSLSSSTGTLGGTTAANAATATYCIPGDTTTCSPPVAEWHLNESAGTQIYDSSGNNNNSSSFVGVPKWKPGKYGSGLEFNNVDTTTPAVVIPDSSTLHLSNFTLETWVRPTASGGLISKRNSYGTLDWQFFIDSNKNITMTIAEGTASLFGTCPPIMGAWNHLAVTKNGNDYVLYRNGALCDTATSAASWTDSDNVRLGQVGSDTGSLTGILDEPRIFNYARSAAQIAWDYNQGDPLAYFKFNECQGTTIHDSSGNGYTGTISAGDASGDNDTVGTCGSGTTTEMWNDGTTGKYNGSLGFDGTNDYVAMSSTAPDISGPQGSISFWMYPTFDPTAAAPVHYVYGNTNSSAGYSDWLFGKSWGANNWDWTVRDRHTYLTGTINQNTWTHIVLTWDEPNYRKIYINGVLNTTNTAWFDTPLTRLDNIGTDHNNVDPWQGLIDEFKVFSYPLTDTQVKTLYNNGAVSFE